jgi:cytochrome c556
MKVALSLAVAAWMVASPVHAQFQKPEDAIKYRKSSLSVMGTHFARLGAMANGRAPYDAKLAAENAEVLETLAKLPWAAFGPGTDQGDTRAKPEIWREQAKFTDSAGKMQTEVGKLVVAARSGNLDQLKAAFGPAAQSCKACHDAYRKD